MSGGQSLSIRLDGRVALVTGAAKGLGRAMAHALAEAGAQVLLVDVDETALHQAIAMARPSDGGAVVALRCDVSRRADCEAAVAAAQARFGSLHVLVNNAGRGTAYVEASPQTTSMRFWETDPEAWRAVIDINVFGTYAMSRAAAPLLIASGSGRIVNITTSLATMQRRLNSPYGVSKAAIEAETLIFAKDLDGAGVTCNSLIPGGAVDTDFVNPEMRANLVREGRGLLSPDIMRAPIVWLASRLSDGITGRRLVGKLWNPALPPDEAFPKALEAPVLLPAKDDR